MNPTPLHAILRMASTVVAVLALLLGGWARGEQARTEQAPPAIEVTPLPDEGDVKRANISTPHYSLYLERYDPQDFGRMMEAAYTAWASFFGKEPEKSKLRVKGYATAASYVAGGKADNTPTYVSPLGNSGYWCSGTKLAHFYATSNVGCMRYMALHEAMHQFHFLAACDNQGCSSDWLLEGLAVWSGCSEWDGQTVKLGHAYFNPIPQAPKTRTEMTRDGPATIAFLSTQYPREFQRLLSQLNRREKEETAWKKAFGFAEPPAAFFDEYYNWRKQKAPARFVSWAHHTRQRAVPAALNIVEWRLGAALEPLVKLRQAMQEAAAATKQGVDPNDAVLAVFGHHVLELIAACAGNSAEGAADCAKDLAELADLFRPKTPPKTPPAATATVRLRTVLQPVSPEVTKEYEGRLRARVLAALGEGRQPAFEFQAFSCRIRILTLDAKGAMKCELETGGRMDLDWSRFSPRDVLNLSLAMAALKDTPEAHALAAFFLLKANAPERADDHFRKAPEIEEAVRRAFRVEEVPAGAGAKSTGTRGPLP